MGRSHHQQAQLATISKSSSARYPVLLMLLTCMGLGLPFVNPAIAAETIDKPALKAQINDLLDGFHHAAATAEGTDYFERFAANGIFMGTDATERWTVEEFKAYAQPIFDEGRGWTYRSLERHITLDATGKIGWFDEILDNDALGRCRGTGVVTRQESGWKLNHYSLTLLIPNSIVDAVGAQTQLIDRAVTK